MSSRYIFRIFQTFSTLVIFTFYSLSTMFYATFLYVFPQSLWPILLFKIVLSYLIAAIRFHLPFFISFRNTHSGEDELQVYWRTTTRGLSTTRNRRRMGIYKTFDFLIFEVLVGFSFSSRCFLCPPNPKSTSSLFLITRRLP